METPPHHRSVVRILFSFDNLMIVVATIAVVGLLMVIPKNFDFLNPVGEALADVDLTDMVFSQFRSDDANVVDTNIVIINVGQSDRAEIAQILRNVNRYEPRVVGLDIFFRALKDPETDSMLADAMAHTTNLVMVSKLAYRVDAADEELDAFGVSVVDPNLEFDTLETSHPVFNKHAGTGFANFIVDQNAAFMTCREVSFRDRCAGKDEVSFAVKIAQFVDPDAAKKALLRGNSAETINYHGNIGSYYHVDVQQALDPEMDLSIVKDKIVLLGYVGPDFQTQSLEDNFFTPLNSQYVGRSYPDMHGVVIHANILSMIFKEDYIDRMSEAMSFIIGFVVLVCNVMLFTYLYTRYEVWYDVIAVAVQLTESLLILYLIIQVFNVYSYKLALTPTLVGVALVGTVHDLYEDSIKKIILRLRRKKP